MIPNNNILNLASLGYKQPSVLVVMINFSKKNGDRIWHKERADLTVGVVATALDCANLTKDGKVIKPERLANTTVEVRFKQEVYDFLVEAIADMAAVGVQLTLEVKDNPVFNILTVNGKDVNSLLFYVDKIMDYKEGVANMESMTFEEQDEVDAFLAQAQEQYRDKREAYRAERRAAAMQDKSLLDDADADAVKANDPASVLD